MGKCFVESGDDFRSSWKKLAINESAGLFSQEADGTFALRTQGFHMGDQLGTCLSFVPLPRICLY